VTALEDSAYQLESEEKGCVAHLRKPYEAGWLVEAIRRAGGQAGAENGK